MVTALGSMVTVDLIGLGA